MHRVLVVDDDESITRLLKTLLSEEGYIVTTSTNGKDALAKVKKTLPSLIILDYMLGGTMNGMDVLKEIKKNYVDIDVIVTTGQGSQKVAVKLMKLGASDYIQKPFGKNEFLKSVKKVLSTKTEFEGRVQGTKVLVVDDEKAVLSFVKHALAGTANVTAVSDSKKALSLINEHQYDLVLTDYYMPGSDGLEVLKRVKEVSPATSVVLMTSTEEISVVRRAMKLGASDYIHKPFTPDEIQGIVNELLTERRKRVFERMKRQFEVQELRDSERNEFILGTVEALIIALEARDAYTSGHSERVTEFSVTIAVEMGLPEAEVEMIRHSARLHDIGKIGTDDSQLYKKQKLSADEKKEMVRHPEVGSAIVKSITFLEEYIPGIRLHHERYDGNGYPDGLTGEEIPLPARIISVADAFDAMLSTRPYRKGLPLDKAIKELKDNSGTQFDPKVVEALLRAVEKATPEHPGGTMRVANEES